MKTCIALLTISCWLLPGGQLLAEQDDAKSDKPAKSSETGVSSHKAKNVISVGLKGGVGLPQLSSALETTFHFQLEAVYLFPFWGSRLGLTTSLGYSQPTASGSGEDPLLPDGAYTWEMTQRQTTWDIGLLVKVKSWRSPWNVGFFAGSRLVFLSTLTSGEAGSQPFGEHDEQATIPGFLAGVQAEYRLGPGALTAELVLASAFEDLRTTGELAVTSLGVMLGYRFVWAL